MMLIVTGGAVHIGAISTAYYSPEGLIEVQTTKIPGHKEYTISESLARRAIEVLNRTVTIAAGIHYDNITKSEIEMIVEIVNKRMDEYLFNKK
ncbi:hypothetical protein PNBC_12140 [Paenibacillus crassostreae]|uniref:Prenylated flavin chaperone LpdD-like domain-containing protein n=2 Tax=Paenibacillus crassostreae TaxID=1763538 RepID=A0A167DYB3_9BACL|nr:hypothetical protein PNBC_12140 [Paenibacillus crassostreae]